MLNMELNFANLMTMLEIQQKYWIDWMEEGRRILTSSGKLSEVIDDKTRIFKKKGKNNLGLKIIKLLIFVWDNTHNRPSERMMYVHFSS